MRLWLKLGIALLLAVGVAAPRETRAQAEAINRTLRLDGGFQEIVLSVPDLEQAVAFYQKVGGWRVVHRGAVGPEILSAWKLPEAARAAEAVLQNPGDPQGFVRLVKFRGVAQEEVRPSARPWDTGGWGGFNVRARDVWQKYFQFRQFGWHAYGQPVQFQLERFTVVEAMMQGPANETVALIQRLDPPLAGFPNLRELSFVTNVFITAKDFDATQAFYTDKLGFKIFLREQGPLAPAGRNLFGLPYNLVNNVYRRIAWVHPQGDDPQNEHAGSIAYMTFYGAAGEDFGPKAHPPNLGLVVTRFPVRDVEARADELRKKGVALEYEPTAIGMLPYGPAKVFAVRDPNGAYIEFFEPASKPE